MSTNWFAGCATVAELKKRYRQLAMDNHPDRGGDTATIQDIHAVYHATLEHFDGITEKGVDGKDHTYRYDRQQEQEIVDKLAAVLREKLPGCEIWLIGKWLWVMGDTYPNRQALSDLDMIWHGKRKAWYWKPAGMYSSHYNKAKDLVDLAATYGVRMFTGRESDMTMTSA